MSQSGVKTSSAEVVAGVDSSGLVTQVATDSAGNVKVTGSASNLPTVDAADGATNTTAPIYATQVGGQDGNGKLQALLVDVSGNLKVTGTASANQQYTDGNTAATPTGIVALGKNGSNVLHAVSLDSSGNLNVNLAAGTISGGNAAASATGAAVPANADYVGVNIAGNLTGVTGHSLTSAKALDVAIVDGSGNQITSFGGGTQFADNAASGTTPTGTLSMGWDSANSKVRALKVDASQNLEVLVQNSSIAVTGTFWQATQPVSGTVTANAGTGTFNTSDSNAISQGSTTSGEKGFLELGAVTTNAPSYTTAQSSPLSLDTSGLLRVSIKDTPQNTNAFKVDGSAVTQPVSGTVTVGNATLAVTESGTWTVQPGNTANTTPWLMSQQAATSGGATPGKLISAASTNSTNIKASAGQIYMLTASNTGSAPRYLKVYDKASAPTVGTDTPKFTFLLPTASTAANGAGSNIPIPDCGIVFTLGIGIAITTGVADSDTGAVGANEVVVNYAFK